jgi:hypothetical protein
MLLASEEIRPKLHIVHNSAFRKIAQSRPRDLSLAMATSETAR